MHRWGKVLRERRIQDDADVGVSSWIEAAMAQQRRFQVLFGLWEYETNKEVGTGRCILALFLNVSKISGTREVSSMMDFPK